MFAMRSFLVAGVVAGCLAASADAQTILSGSYADENVSTASVLERAPGRMVSAGVGRTQAAAQQARAGYTITETGPEDLSPRQVFTIDAIEIVFEELNNAIYAFYNLMLLRAGELPVVPTPVFPDADTTGTGTANPQDNQGLGGLDLGDLSGLLDQFGLAPN